MKLLKDHEKILQDNRHTSKRHDKLLDESKAKIKTQAEYFSDQLETIRLNFDNQLQELISQQNVEVQILQGGIDEKQRKIEEQAEEIQELMKKIDM